MSVFLEKEFIDAGYETNVLHDQILFVKNFLTDNELNKIVDWIFTD